MIFLNKNLLIFKKRSLNIAMKSYLKEIFKIDILYKYQ